MSRPRVRPLSYLEYCLTGFLKFSLSLLLVVFHPAAPGSFLTNKSEDFPLLGETLSCLQSSWQSSLCLPCSPSSHCSCLNPPRAGRVPGSLSSLGLMPSVCCVRNSPHCSSQGSNGIPGLQAPWAGIPCPKHPPHSESPPRWMGSLVVTDSFSRMEQEMPGGQGCLCTSSSKRFYLALDR